MSSPPFSNGYEWDCWSSRWCMRCQREDVCPILDNVFLNEVVPPEWTPGTDDLYDRYHCSMFLGSDRNA